MSLPVDRIVTLEELPWEHRRQVVDAFLHAAFIRPALRKGPASSKDVGQRVGLYWQDDRNLPALPASNVGDLEPVVW